MNRMLILKNILSFKRIIYVFDERNSMNLICETWNNNTGSDECVNKWAFLASSWQLFKIGMKYLLDKAMDLEGACPPPLFFGYQTYGNYSSNALKP